MRVAFAHRIAFRLAVFLTFALLGVLTNLVVVTIAVAGEPIDSDLVARRVWRNTHVSETTIQGPPEARLVARRQWPHTAIPGASPQAPVKIIMYHYIRDVTLAADSLARNLSVSPQDFEAQMRLLVSKEYTTLSLDEVYEARQEGKPLPPRSVVLTFDDGYEDFFTTARPILQALGLKATVYVITARVGQPGYMTWDQARQVVDEGFTVGSHTVAHLNLTTLTDSGLTYELEQSRQVLEAQLGRPVVHFAYPSGAFDARVRQAAARAGYLTATTTKYGACLPDADYLALPRLRVLGGASLVSFSSLLNSPTRK